MGCTYYHTLTGPIGHQRSHQSHVFRFQEVLVGAISEALDFFRFSSHGCAVEAQVTGGPRQPHIRGYLVADTKLDDVALNEVVGFHCNSLTVSDHESCDEFLSDADPDIRQRKNEPSAGSMSSMLFIVFAVE